MVAPRYALWQWLLGLLVLVCGLCVVTWYAFDYGRVRAGFDSVGAALDIQRLQSEVATLEAEKDKLLNRMAVLERARQVEQQANSQAMSGVDVLQNEIMELKEKLALYQGIVAPDDEGESVRVQALKVYPDPAGGNRYAYKLVLAQLQSKGKVVTGTLTVTLDGRLGETEEHLGLDRVTSPPVEELSFRLKYLQTLEGQFDLPGEFIPSGVTVHLLPLGRDLEPHIRRFEWTEVLQLP